MREPVYKWHVKQLMTDLAVRDGGGRLNVMKTAERVGRVLDMTTDAILHAYDGRRKPSPAPLTACRRGHAFTQENSRVRPNGTRVCRECDRSRLREYEKTRAPRVRVYVSRKRVPAVSASAAS